MSILQSWTGDNRSATIRWLWLLLAVAALVLYPTLKEDVAARAFDSGTVHIFRGLVFSQAISDGVLFPRWTQFLHLGLGSPLFTFLTPLSYYGMDFFARLGIPHPIGWRLLAAGALLLGFLGTYLLVYTLTRVKWASLLGGAAFLFAPYVLRNMLGRGTPEAFSMVLYPWVIWSLVWLAQRPSGLRLILASLLWAACIAGHVLAPLMLAPFAAVVALALAWRYRTVTPLVALVAGGLLMAPVWAPMVSEQAYVHVERDFSEAYANPVVNPIPLDRLLAAPVVYDTQRDNNQIGDQVGLLQLLLLVLAIPGTVVAWRAGRKDLAAALIIAVVVALFLFWLLTAASNPLWDLLAGALRRLQYRFRLMGVLALAMAVAAGILVALLPKRWQAPAALALSALLILVALPSLYVGLQHLYATFGTRPTLADARAAEIQSGGTAFTQYNEFEPLWREAPMGDALVAEIGPDFDPSVAPLVEPSSALAVVSSQVASSRWDLQLQATAPTTATLHLLYYPRWQATLDGSPAALQPQPVTGYVQAAIPPGDHSLTLRYGRTAVETIAIAISLLTGIALVATGVRDLLKRRRGARVPAPVVAPPETAPSWWLLAGFTLLIAFKWFYVDTSTTWLRCVSTPERVCGADSTTDVAFAGGPRLRGYAVPSQTVKPGEDFRVALYWQADEKPADNLYGFVHIRNSQPDLPVNPRSGSEIWAQQDNFTPGNLSTTDYVPGKLYRDEYRVPIPEDIPPGDYYLEVGWLNPATGEQLEPLPESVTPPLDILWRSILLPSVTVE
ncbi:MAG: hypothetical protein KDI55_07490 [Anaerolineae bacterium]|nr:hypothetical protein [Anaerolineae bacterium]